MTIDRAKTLLCMVPLESHLTPEQIKKMTPLQKEATRFGLLPATKLMTEDQNLTTSEQQVQDRIKALNECRTPQEVRNLGYPDVSQKRAWYDLRQSSLNGTFEFANRSFLRALSTQYYSVRLVHYAVSAFQTTATLPVKYGAAILSLNGKKFREAVHTTKAAFYLGICSISCIFRAVLDPVILAYNCTPITPWTKRVLVILLIDVQYTFIPQTDRDGQQVKDSEGNPVGTTARKLILKVINPHSGELPVWEGDKIINPINVMMECRKPENTHVILSADSHSLGHGATDKVMNTPAFKMGQPFKMGQLDGEPQMAFVTHGVSGSRGQKFPIELGVNGEEIVVEKGGDDRVDSFSALYDNRHQNRTGLAAFLRKLGVTDIAVVGLAYEYCVGDSALDAAMEGFNTYIVKEGTRPFRRSDAVAKKEKLKKAGVKEISLFELFEHTVLGQFFDETKTKQALENYSSLEGKGKGKED